MWLTGWRTLQRFSLVPWSVKLFGGVDYGTRSNWRPLKND